MNGAKLSLDLKLGQQLTMTPQLRQAIRLLQLPVLELSNEIEQALVENVMLEREEPSEPMPEVEEQVVGQYSLRYRRYRCGFDCES